MKIIRERSTNRVVYFFNDNDNVILSDNNLSGEVTDLTVKRLTHELVENVTPLNFNPQFGQLRYDTDFHVLDENSYSANEIAFKNQQEKESILNEIAFIESTITPRRQREAILAIDTTWLADIELQIGQLRQQLAELQNAI